MNQLFDRFIAAAALNLIQSLYRALKAERNFFFFFKEKKKMIGYHTTPLGKSRHFLMCARKLGVKLCAERVHNAIQRINLKLANILATL